MLIFHKFKTMDEAAKVAKHITDNFRLRAIACLNQTEADKFDYYPFRLDGVILLVEHCFTVENKETEIQKFVESNGGEFAGT